MAGRIIPMIASDLKRAPRKTIAFTGASGLGLAGTAVIVWTITGRVQVVSFPSPFITEALVSTVNLGTISIGLTNSVTFFTAAVTVGAGDFAVNDWWYDGAAIPSYGRDHASVGVFNTEPVPPISENIIINCLTQNITDGTLVFDGLWYRPLTADGALT